MLYNIAKISFPLFKHMLYALVAHLIKSEKPDFSPLTNTL